MTDSITLRQVIETNEFINAPLVATGDAYTTATCGSMAMIDDMISKLVTIKNSLKTVSTQIDRNLGTVTGAVAAANVPTLTLAHDADDTNMSALNNSLVVCTVRDSSETTRQADNGTLAKCVGVYTEKTTE